MKWKLKSRKKENAERLKRVEREQREIELRVRRVEAIVGVYKEVLREA